MNWLNPNFLLEFCCMFHSCLGSWVHCVCKMRITMICPIHTPNSGVHRTPYYLNIIVHCSRYAQYTVWHDHGHILSIYSWLKYLCSSCIILTDVHCAFSVTLPYSDSLFTSRTPTHIQTHRRFHRFIFWTIISIFSCYHSRVHHKRKHNVYNVVDRLHCAVCSMFMRRILKKKKI